MTIEFSDFIDYYNSIEINGKVIDYLDIILNTSLLRYSSIMLIPLIGVFVNKKIGWLLILSFYYFWISLFIFTLVASNFNQEGGFIIIAIGFILISIFFVAIMNASENSEIVYNIHKKELLKMNLAAFIISIIEIVLTYFFIYTYIF